MLKILLIEILQYCLKSKTKKGVLLYTIYFFGALGLLSVVAANLFYFYFERDYLVFLFLFISLYCFIVSASVYGLNSYMNYRSRNKILQSLYVYKSLVTNMTDSTLKILKNKPRSFYMYFLGSVILGTTAFSIFKYYNKSKQKIN